MKPIKTKPSYPIIDAFGNELKVGDLIAHPLSSSSIGYLCYYIIDGFDDDNSLVCKQVSSYGLDKGKIETYSEKRVYIRNINKPIVVNTLLKKKSIKEQLESL